MKPETAKILLIAGVFDLVLGLVFVSMGSIWAVIGGLLAAGGFGIAGWAAIKLRG